MEKGSSMLYPTLCAQKVFKILRAIVRVITEMLSATEILTTSIVEGLLVEQGRYLERK